MRWSTAIIISLFVMTVIAIAFYEEISSTMGGG